jgi:type II secretory pathway pseudopilin PulG
MDRVLLKNKNKARCSGFTLPEVVIAGALAAITLAGIIYGYVLSAQSAEWSSYYTAAQSLAMQRLEQTRAAKWDLQAEPRIDNLVSSNFPKSIEVLDIPITKTNVVYATNLTTITTLSTNPPLKMIRVDCTWAFAGHRVFTNTLVSYRAPDQ